MTACRPRRLPNESGRDPGGSAISFRAYRTRLPGDGSKRESGRRWSTHATSGTCCSSSASVVVLALVEDRPSFARMYRDERVGLCRYDTRQPAEALDQLAMAAELCAQVFEGIDATGWSRPLVYNWPEPATFDLAWLGRHTVHELEHHLQDVASVLQRITARNQ